MVEANPTDVIDDTKADMIDDESVYKEKDNDVFTEDFAYDFSVKNPQNTSGHVVYEVKGKDNQGEWECKRRYNEFYILWETLQKRWPGILLP